MGSVSLAASRTFGRCNDQFGSGVCRALPRHGGDLHHIHWVILQCALAYSRITQKQFRSPQALCVHRLGYQLCPMIEKIPEKYEK